MSQNRLQFKLGERRALSCSSGAVVERGARHCFSRPTAFEDFAARALEATPTGNFSANLRRECKTCRHQNSLTGRRQLCDGHQSAAEHLVSAYLPA